MEKYNTKFHFLVGKVREFILENKQKWNLSVNECFIRANIIRNVFQQYEDLNSKLDRNDKFYKEKIKLYKPGQIYTFYNFFLPFYFVNSNLILLFNLRKDISLTKYFSFFMINFLSLYFVFVHVDNRIFLDYIKKPSPYGKYMREEFLKHKSEISESSFRRVYNINVKINKFYKF
jgi:hypothetical protein